MKVLITGGCGYLGSNLAASYLQEGAEVIVVDALFRRGSAANLAWLENQSFGGQFHFIQSDLADAEGVMAVVRRHAPFDYICHVGGVGGVGSDDHIPAGSSPRLVDQCSWNIQCAGGCSGIIP